jgi:hypothetical protein
VTATYLGLTNKHFYVILKKLNGHKCLRLCHRVKIEGVVHTRGFRELPPPPPLFALLKTWMQPRVSGASVGKLKFITAEKFEELDAEMKRRVREKLMVMEVRNWTFSRRMRQMVEDIEAAFDEIDHTF